MKTITPLNWGYEITDLVSPVNDSNTLCYTIHAPERTQPLHFLRVTITENNGKYHLSGEGEINGAVDFTKRFGFSTLLAAREWVEAFFVRQSGVGLRERA